MTDPNNSGGFTTDSNGVWVDPTQLPAGGQDFVGWTWKQIEAAILGGGSMTVTADSASRAKGNVDPQTLQDAANIFETAQQTLSVISQSIKDQTAALAGENGPWKGTAATQFVQLMATMAAKVDGQVDQLTGGGDSSRSIPNQLANSAAYLQWAQNTIRYIDSYYAQQVIARGQQLGDGRAYISQFPEAVQMMTNDMKNVADQLEAKYNTFAVKTLSVPDTTGTGTPGPGNPPPPPSDVPPPPSDVPPPSSSPPSAGPPPDTGGSSGGGGGNPQPFTSASIAPPPGGSGGGGGNLPPFTSASIAPPPGGSGGGGGNLPPFTSASIAPPPGGGGAGGGGGILSPNLSGPPGSGGGSGLNGAGNIPPFIGANIPAPPGSIGSGSGNSKSGTGNGTSGLNNFQNANIGSGPGGAGTGAGGLGSFHSLNVGGAPGGINATGTGPGTGNAGLTGLGGTGLNNNALAPVNLPPSLANPPGNVNAGGASTPMMPPGGMGGGATGANNGSDRPDSAGLLGGVEKPWTVAMPNGLGDPNSLGETPPLQSASWAPPPGIGTGGGGVAPGASDAAHIPGAGAFTPPPSGSNVPNLTGNRSSVPLPGGGAPPLGAPMMPPPGGAAAGTAGSATDRPDSAGLLSGASQPWANGPAPDGVGDPNVVADTPPEKPASWVVPPPVPPAATPPAPPPAGQYEVDGSVATADPAPSAETAAPAPARPRWGLSDAVAGTNTPATNPVPPVAPAQTPAISAHHKDHAVAPGLGAGPEGAVSPDAAIGGHGAEPSPFPSQDQDSVLRVAVVRPTESVEDISAWDVGTAEFLPGLLPASGWAASETPEEEFVLDLVERSNEPWKRGEDYELEPMSAEMATYRRRKQGEGEFISDGEWPMCSGEEAPPEPEDSDEDVDVEDDEDGEEEEERSMADLLSQDDSAWGRAVSKPSGVLE
jgi:uncharacterized protein YukE